MEKNEILPIILGVLGIVIGLLSLRQEQQLLAISLGGVFIIAGFITYYVGKIEKQGKDINNLKKELDYKKDIHKIEKELVEVKTMMMKKNKKGNSGLVMAFEIIAIIVAIYVILKLLGQVS